MSIYVFQESFCTPVWNPAVSLIMNVKNKAHRNDKNISNTTVCKLCLSDEVKTNTDWLIYIIKYTQSRADGQMFLLICQESLCAFLPNGSHTWVKLGRIPKINPFNMTWNNHMYVCGPLQNDKCQCYISKYALHLVAFCGENYIWYIFYIFFQICK